MGRGELLALRWSEVQVPQNEARSPHHHTASVSRRHARDHRKAQLKLRLQLGMGKHEPDALVFFNHDGSPISPNYTAKMWRITISAISDFPRVSFHSLRHSPRNCADRRQDRRGEAPPRA